MWKKALLVLSLFAFTFVVSAPLAGHADAKPRSFSSGVKSYSKTPSQSQNTFNSGTTSKSTTGTTAASTANRGFFSGGGFWKGMMVGGLAGMLFGGLFGGLGFMGNLLGFMVNLIGIVILFVLIRAAFNAFRRRQDPPRPDYPNQGRRW
jgi:predicted lipid-binding transport protein (Tim44 family)